jgi:sugar phosphate isomerase/epimerase
MNLVNGNLSFKNYFDLGIVIPSVFPEMSNGSGPIIENLDYVLNTGLFQVVETTYRNSEEDYLAVKHFLSQKKIRTIYLTPFVIYQKKLDLNSLDEPERQKAVSILKELIQRAYFLNAEKLIFCSGPDPGIGERKEAKKQLIQSLFELLEYTQSLKRDYLLELILENYDRELQMKRLLGPTDESVELVMEVRNNFNNIYLMLDQSHLRQLGENPRKSLSLAIKCLGHVHLANCLLKDRSHPQWGDGHIAFNTEGSELGIEDIVELFSFLFEVGYLKREPKRILPTISLEIKPTPPEGNRYATFHQTCETFLEAWKIFKVQAGME